MLRRLRRPRRLQRLMIELHRPADDFKRLSAIGGLDLHDHVVSNRLFILGELDETLERRPLTLHRFQMLPPVVERLAAYSLCDYLGGRLGIFHQRKYIREAGIISGLGDTQMLERVADVARRADDTQIDRASVGG